MNKENLRPKTKQGIQYEINIGKSNGAYLSQDIAHDNYLSVSLLTRQAQEAHKSFAKTITLMSKQPDCEMSKPSNQSEVQSFNQTYRFLTKGIQKMKEEIFNCGVLSKKLRREIEEVKQKSGQQNNQLLQSAMPAFKSLREKIRGDKSIQTATYSKLRRELENIEKTFKVVGNGIRQCESKMSISEYKFGKNDNFDGFYD